MKLSKKEDMATIENISGETDSSMNETIEKSAISNNQVGTNKRNRQIENCQTKQEYNSNHSKESSSDSILKKNKLGKLTTFDIQVLLYNKINEYGGYAGLWEILKSRFSFTKNMKTNNSIDFESILKKDTFRNQVNRLQNKQKNGEKMILGPKSNILLLLHILEILNINNISDLLNDDCTNDGMNKIIYETYQNTKNIEYYFNELKNYIELSARKKPRFTELKVFNDSESFFFRMNSIIVSQRDFVYFQNNQEKNKNFMIPQGILDIISKDFKLPVLIFNILYNYREYYSHDKILQAYKNIAFSGNYFNWCDISSYDSNWWIMFYLHTLYLHTIINEKFLSKISIKPGVFLSKDEIDKNNASIMAKEICKELENGIKLFEEKKPGQFIYDKNIEMRDLLSGIITKYNENNSNCNYKKEMENMGNTVRKWIQNFFDLYFNSTSPNEMSIANYCKKMRNYGDVYFHSTCGILYSFIISRNHILRINECCEDIKILKKKIK
jgi:hypothetical protein